MKRQLRLSSGRKLISPTGRGTRPTTSKVREAIMNIISNRIANCHWIDLFSGSGIMSCEALIRNAKKIVAIEKNPKAFRVCKENLRMTGEDLSGNVDLQVINNDVLIWLKNKVRIKSFWQEIEVAKQGFDIAYLDPPYDSNLHYAALDALLNGSWLKANSLVICEHSAESSLKTPSQWVEQGRKNYGTSALLLLSPL